MKLRQLNPDQLAAELAQRCPLDGDAQHTAQQIIDRVAAGGDAALRELAESFGELEKGAPLIRLPAELEGAYHRIDESIRGVLERSCQRIQRFAWRQLDCLCDLQMDIDGGVAGHTRVPIERVGCYVPGGRYPLVSSALMTAATARAAGCRQVSVAVPNPDDVMLAACHISNVDQVLSVGGAQAIAALALGTESVPAVDILVGPGNRWVTAAKQLVSGRVAIDMLAGPTELVVLTDGSGDPEKIAADLLAQAEHDIAARPMLVTCQAAQVDAIEAAISRQLAGLTTAETARASLAANGLVVACKSLDEAIEASNCIAPEHLEIVCQDSAQVAGRIQHAGCLFFGEYGAEVFGDYAIGPNHTLPTSGTARFTAGLSVFNFVRVRSYLQMNQLPTSQTLQDIETLAQLEGLAAHQAACQIRRHSANQSQPTGSAPTDP